MKSHANQLNLSHVFPSAREPEFLKSRINRHYRDRVQELWGGRNLLHGIQPGKNSIQLMSNDYLSISNHPDIKKSQSDSLLSDGGSMLMSAVFLHGDSPQQRFEQRLAHFMGAERGILCQSGWCANTGLIQSIANEQTPVYIVGARLKLPSPAR